MRTGPEATAGPMHARTECRSPHSGCVHCVSTAGRSACAIAQVLEWTRRSAQRLQHFRYTRLGFRDATFMQRNQAVTRSSVGEVDGGRIPRRARHRGAWIAAAQARWAAGTTQPETLLGRAVRR